jgi:dTDP-4-dehydrorhamnose 3,5-epimerase
LRGLHYQLNPHAQGKLVRVVQGRAWDVAVDIRENSPTFGEWVGLSLQVKTTNSFGFLLVLHMALLHSKIILSFYIKPRIITLKNVKEVLYGMIQILRLIGLLKKELSLKLTDKDENASRLTDAALF